jgi:CheY-like chemotaxis protein
MPRGPRVSPGHPDVVAVFNTSEDTTDMLRFVIEQAGYVVVTAFTNELRDGAIDLEALMRQHRPKVVVYDIAIPYDVNWRLFEHIRASPACEGVQFVITTTHEKHVKKIAGTAEQLIEIVGKPYDLDLVVQAVHKAAGRKGTD